MLAICAALRWELRPLLRAAGTARAERLDGVRMWWVGKPSSVVLFQTGIGFDRAGSATEAVLARLPIRAVINTGCAGALVDDLAPGDLVIPDSVHHADAPGAEFPTDPVWSSHLRAAARRAGIDPHARPLVTALNALGTAEVKRSAHARYGAAAVEMEGSAVARAAASRHLPFASARAILDPLDIDLPSTGSDGKIGWLKTAANPAAAAQLVRLTRYAFAMQQTLYRLFAALLRESSDIEGFV